MAGDRTEKATPQRRDKARREGDITHSRELTSAAGTLAGVMLLRVAWGEFLGRWGGSLETVMGLGAAAHWESTTMAGTLRALVAEMGATLAPFALVGAAVTAGTLGAGVLQTGGLQIHPQVLAWKLDRVSPLANAKNMFSLRALARLGKSLVPTAILAVFVVARIERQWTTAPFSTERMAILGGDVWTLLLAAAWVMFGWALIDYVVEWRSREMRLRMSREEMREEFRDTEGNPQIRGRIRNLQRQARRRRVRQDVAKAAVVITNPTHYAVALGFDFETMEAPKVLAKGRNLMAEEIKQEARWAGVPVIENPPLARSLYRVVEPGQSIPVDLYAAVASILAYLYRQRVAESARQRQTARRAAEPPRRASAEPPLARIPGARRATGRAATGQAATGRAAKGRAAKGQAATGSAATGSPATTGDIRRPRGGADGSAGTEDGKGGKNE